MFCSCWALNMRKGPSMFPTNGLHPRTPTCSNKQKWWIGAEGICAFNKHIVVITSFLSTCTINTPVLQQRTCLQYCIKERRIDEIRLAMASWYTALQKSPRNKWGKKTVKFTDLKRSEGFWTWIASRNAAGHIGLTHTVTCLCLNHHTLGLSWDPQKIA